MVRILLGRREAIAHGHGQRLTHLSTSPFLSEELPDKAERDQYKLLCPDNTWKSVEEYKECHLAQVPSHAVVARSVRGKEDAIWELLSQAQVHPPAVPKTCLSLGCGGELPLPNFCSRGSLRTVGANPPLDSRNIGTFPGVSPGQALFGSSRSRGQDDILQSPRTSRQSNFPGSKL